MVDLNSHQRAGLYAGLELEIRLLTTAADLKYKNEFKN